MKKAMDVAMDSKVKSQVQKALAEQMEQIESKERLTAKLKHFTGVFDSKSLSKKEIVKKGLDHFKISAPQGHEEVYLDAYLQGRKSVSGSVNTMDSKINKKENALDTTIMELSGV